MKILITGSNGFVGRNLTTHLNSVDGMSTVSLNLRNQFSELDFAGVTSVIHLAGKAHDVTGNGDEKEYFEVNTDLTRVLFDAFLQSNVRDFVYFSSVKAVADTVEEILHENTEPMPLTPYGKSKQQAEIYLLSKQIPFEKRLFIIRPCMIHGPGNKGNLNLLYKVVKRGIPYPLAAFKNQRSFLSIANLNYIVERLISDSLIPGGVYNVADDEPLSTNDLINLISNAIGSKARLLHINSKLIKAIAAVGDRLRLPLNSERLKKLTESYVVSNKKIKEVLNIERLPVSSSQGLLTTIKSFSSV